MVGNPFHYGTPVGPEHFAGRDRELAALSARMADGINVVVASPRRYGKTSLLLRAEAAAEGAGGAVVHVNVLRCRDATDLAARLAGATFRLPSGRWHRARNAIGEFARRLRLTPTVSFGADGAPRFGFGTDLAGPDLDAVLGDVYALLAEEAAHRPAALVLDEFQAITDLGGHLPGELKGLADAHHRVSLVLAGSRAHLMEQLTASAGAPLYGMAEHLALGPVDPSAMAAYLDRRAAVGGRPLAAGVAGEILAVAGPVPNDVQRLAYAAFEAAGAGAGRVAVDAEAVAAGLATTVAHDAAAYSDLYGRLATGQRRVLAAVAAGPVAAPYAAAFARSVGLANGASVRKAIAALANEDLLARRDGTWVVADPFLAGWLRGLADA